MLFNEKNFTEFILHTWINQDKYRGASRICAIFLNFLFGVFKILVCGIILLLLLPHIAVGNLRRKSDLTFCEKLTKVFLTIISLMLDVPILAITIFSIIATFQCLFEFTFPLFLISLLFGCISYYLINVLLMFFCALFGKSNVKLEPNVKERSSVNDKVCCRDIESKSFKHQIVHDVECLSAEKLWGSDNQDEWFSALSYYYELLRPKQRILEQYMENLDSEDILKYSVDEFFDFLYNKYFVWKYTAANRLATTRKALNKYILENRLYELDEIKTAIFESDKLNIENCLKITVKIRGLGVAGASGLLSILFPKYFATLDQFVVKSLMQISDLPNKEKISTINPENIKIDEAVILIKTLRDKSNELNLAFDTDFWTPRKLDMILWSIGR